MKTSSPLPHLSTPPSSPHIPSSTHAADLHYSTVNKRCLFLHTKFTWILLDFTRSSCGSFLAPTPPPHHHHHLHRQSGLQVSSYVLIGGGRGELKTEIADVICHTRNVSHREQAGEREALCAIFFLSADLRGDPPEAQLCRSMTGTLCTLK